MNSYINDILRHLWGLTGSALLSTLKDLISETIGPTETILVPNCSKFSRLKKLTENVFSKLVLQGFNRRNLKKPRYFRGFFDF